MHMEREHLRRENKKRAKRMKVENKGEGGGSSRIRREGRK